MSICAVTFCFACIHAFWFIEKYDLSMCLSVHVVGYVISDNKNPESPSSRADPLITVENAGPDLYSFAWAKLSLL